VSATLESLDRILAARGKTRELGAFVVACAFDRSGDLAFALGDGTVHMAARGGDAFSRIEAHDGAVLALARDIASGFVTGGDDGRFVRVGADGAVRDIARFGSKWVEQVASFADEKTRLLACAVGKSVHLFDAEGVALKQLAHPSTVTGIAFDQRGKRVAASHYGGASLWFVGSKSDNPRLLEWKGSHVGIMISPDGDSIVTAMQENSLHGWRLSDGQHMRMSGYPGKTLSMEFSRNGRWLATSGAESVVLWPFFGGGPMGKAPTELAGMGEALCTRVAYNPRDDAVAAGFSDGLVVIASTAKDRILPVAAPGRGSISALTWSFDGAYLAFGTETGFVALVDFSKAA
jgi:WD40 repeat protein